MIGSINRGWSRVVGMLGGEGVKCGAASPIWVMYVAVIDVVWLGGHDDGVHWVEVC